MAKQDVNIGVEGNDGTGDSIRESFRKVNENFNELYAVFGEGGQISLTDLGDIAIDSFENFPSTDSAPVMAGINNDTQGSKLEFFRFASDKFIDPTLDDSIAFDASRIDDDGRPVIVVRAVKSDLASDSAPTLGGNLDMAGNFVAYNPAPANTWKQKAEDNGYTIDDVLITKGYADSNYLKGGGTGTGSQLRVRTEDEISTEDYTFTINSYTSGNAVINDRYIDGVLTTGQGHGFDSSANGASFTYSSTLTSAIDQTSTKALTDLTEFPTGTFFVRVVSDTQLGLYRTKTDAEAGTNKLNVAGGTGTQQLADFYYQPKKLTGDFLANEAIPRESIVRRQGDQMAGKLYLEDHPGELAGIGTPNGIEDLQAASKFYVDNTSFASNINLFVSTTGDDTQASTPPGKEGRSLAYAYRSVNAAARRAEEIVVSSPVEPGPYMQKIEYGANAQSLVSSKIYSADFKAGERADYGASTEKFNSLVIQNKDFVIAETIKWVSLQIATANADLTLTESDPTYIWKNFAYNEAICARDLGYIIDAGRLDTRSSTTANKLSRSAGLRYYSNSSGRLAVTTQEAQTIATINKAKELFESYILINTAYPNPLNADYDQFFDVGLVDAPSAAIDVFSAKIGIVTNIIDNGIDSAPALREGAPYVLRITNGGNDSVWQGKDLNTDLIPGKVVTGSRSGAIGRIITYSNDINDATNTDELELILEEPFEFLVDGAGRDIQNVEVSDSLGDELEYGNRVSQKQITIKVESGIYEEDYPIKVSSQVSVVGDEMRRAIIRPKNRVSQSKWANTYFYRDKYFDGLTLHSNTVTFADEVALTLAGGTLTAYKGDILTQTSTFTYNEAKCRRDIQYILEQAGFDIVLGTNYNQIVQGLAYQNTSAGVVQASQLQQELASIGFAGNRVALLDDVADNTSALSRSRAYFATVLDLIENGNTDENSVNSPGDGNYVADITSTLVFPDFNGVDSNKVAARDKLQANKPFIKTEIIAHINNDTTPPAGFDSDMEDLLEQNIGRWTDALTYNILYGGNDAASTQARLYFTDTSLNINGTYQTVVKAAITHFKTIVTDILTGVTRSGATGNDNTDGINDQVVSGDNASATEGSEAQSLLDIIYNAVNNQTLPTGVTLPTSALNAADISQALRDAKGDIDTNIASGDASVNIIDLTIDFINSNTDSRAVVQEDVVNGTAVVVTYNDGYNPAGANFSASPQFNLTDDLKLNGALQSGLKVASADTTNTKDFDMGWHYASDSRKPINTNSALSVNNLGNRINASLILAENKINIQEDIYDWMDIQATAAQTAGFGTWAETTIVFTGTVTAVKGETMTQATTGASGKVKDDPINAAGKTTVVLVSPTTIFNTANQLTGSESGSHGAAGVPESVNVGKFSFTTKCKRDIGYIVDALANDLTKGRNDASMQVQGLYYEGAVEVGQEEITTQAISRIATVCESLLNVAGIQEPNGTVLTTWKTNFAAAEDGSSGVVTNLINTITYAFNPEYNPPIHNRDMDVFLMNDATIIRNCTVQGHGGFMTVLDPAGQILTKSPYIQTGSSFSQSVNKQAFRGGMFVDGFNGNMPLEIVGRKNGNNFRLFARSKRSQVQVNGVGVGHGLFVRRPEVPAPFYVNGIRYQVNSIINHDQENGTCELILDDNSGVKDGNGNGLGWEGPVTHYTLVNDVRTPQYGQSENYTTVLQTAGNRSQLGNDFTQINDLGYGLLVTNTGLSEMVGMFTYYCHAAYYANNGSEIRSVGGSNAYGNFGLVAAGSDPNEVPQSGELAYNTVQTAKVYRNESAQFEAEEQQNYVYVYDTDFIPLPEGEIDITFAERTALVSFTGTNTVEVTGHGYETGTKVTIENTVGVTGLNDDHYINRVDANTFTIFSDAALTSARNFSGSLSTLGAIIPADEAGTDVRKYEVVNVIPAIVEDLIPAVNQQEFTLSGAVKAHYGDTVTQETTGAIGKVVRPQRTSNVDGVVVGGTTLFISQADSPAALFNTSDKIKITDVYSNTDTTEFTDNITINTIDSSSDTSGLPLKGGNGAVWKITFSNQTSDSTSATGGLAQQLYGGESVVIRTRAKVIFDNVESTDIRPSTAVVLSEGSKVYRSLAFNEQAISSWGDTADQTLPSGFNLVTFDDNYKYILATVAKSKFESQVKLTLGAGVAVTRGDVVTQGSASGVVTESQAGATVIYLSDWNGTSFTTSSITINATSTTVTDIVEFSNTTTFGATAGDTKVALTSPVTDADSLGRLNSGSMIFGWKDRVHVVVAYHDGEGNTQGTPAAGTQLTGFPYFEVGAAALVDKNTQVNPTPPGTGIARPLDIGSTQQVVLSVGAQDGIGASITVNISLNRATGHDFSNIGTGGFNTSNYPNILFGNPSEAKAEAYTNSDVAEKSQVWERGKGRVFVMSTDEDGFFRVGKFFEVDQGTGTVKFAAQINISGLDGLGFRDGETISKFTGDNGMSPIDNSTVPTSYAVEQYIDRRLGFDRNMNVKAALLGDGFLPQKNPILTITRDSNNNPNHTLNMQSGRLVQLADPTDDLDATTKQYVDKRVFANDEVQELKDIELNDISFEDDYGKNDLLVLTGNRRVYVKQTIGNPDDWRIGQLITGVASETAAYIEDLEAKTLDNGEEIYVLTYSPLQITSIQTSGANNNLTAQRGFTVTQSGTGATGEILWEQDQSTTNENRQVTQGNEIRLINTTGTFVAGNSANVLTITDLFGTAVSTTVYPLSITIPTVSDFSNEKIENTDGAYGNTTGGFDGAVVTTTLEFANASESNLSGDGVPGSTTRSDVNIAVERIRGTMDSNGQLLDPGSTKVNLQLQAQSIINADVNNEADIIQSKLDMNNAPVLTNSNNFEDASTAGQRTKQANQGLAAFNADVFAEDQIWTLQGADVTAFIASLAVNDVITQTAGAKEAYVVATDTGVNQIKVRVSTAFTIGNAGANRLTRISINQSDYTQDADAQSNTTINTILNTGFINVKDRGITFDKIQDLPEKTLIGRADIDFDGEQEGAGESGIARAIPFSLVVDEGGGLQDKDFNDSVLTKVSGTIIVTTGELTLPDGTNITQVGNTGATGTIQGAVNTENELVLVDTAGTFNTTGQLQIVSGSALGTQSVPTSVITSQNLLGSALVKIRDGVYGSSIISKTGSDDSIVRTLKNGDTISGVDNTLNLGGWINPRGLLVDSRRVLDTQSDTLSIYTPNDHLSIQIEGTAPSANTPLSDKSTVSIPNASVQIGSTTILKDPINYGGFAGNFQQNTEGPTQSNSEPYLVTPWVYTNYIQAPGELTSEGTGISIGAGGRHTGLKEIGLVVAGYTDAFKVKETEILLGTNEVTRVKILNGSTSVYNSFNIVDGTDVKFSVAGNTGNTSIVGTLGVTDAVTANAGITVDDSVFDGNKISRTNGDFEIETVTVAPGTGGDIILNPAGENVIFKDGTDERLNFATTEDAQELTTQGAFTIDVNGTEKAFTVEATGNIVLDAELDIELNANGGDVVIKDATADIFKFANTANGLNLDYLEQDKILSIRGNDAGTMFDALTFDMENDGNAQFSNNVLIDNDLTVTGNVAFNGNIELGNAVTDTITTNAIITDEVLELRLDDNGAAGFNLKFQKTTDNVAGGDDLGVITFQSNGAVSTTLDQIKSTITANATEVTNSGERSNIVFATASGVSTTANRLVISDTITSSANIVANNTETLGTSGTPWSKAYVTDNYGTHHGDIKDSSGNVIVDVGTVLAGSDANASVFYGKFNGPLTGGVDTAGVADTLQSSQEDGTATDADVYPLWVTSNPAHTSRTGHAAFTTANFKLNPSNGNLTLNGQLGADTINIGSSNLSSIGLLTADIYASDGTSKILEAGTDGDDATFTGDVTGQVSSLSNHDTADLSEGTNLYYTDTRVSTYLSNNNYATTTDVANAVSNGASANIAVSNTNSSASDYFITFTDSNGASQSLSIDKDGGNGLKYRPSDSTLTATNFSGTASSANFADLAEKYVGDQAYEPGTVLVFGGDNEVTICTAKGDRKVAGVVSTDPAYLMNNALKGDTVVELALTGRVPCKVIGTVEKGDMLVTSAIPGYAMVDNDPKLGTVIGKAVESKDSDGKGVIEVVVGRM